MKDALTNLTCAQDLIRDPKHWIKKAYKHEDPEVGTCRCLTGAVQAATPVLRERIVAHKYLQRAIMQLNLVPVSLGFPDEWRPGDIVYFNDYPKTTHADVMAVMDLAREMAAADKQKNLPLPTS